MQLQACKLYITDSLIKQQQFINKIAPKDLFSNTESNKVVVQPLLRNQIYQLRIPLISILYAYIAGPDLQGYQFEMDAEILANSGTKDRQKSERISTKLIKSSKFQHRSGCIQPNQNKIQENSNIVVYYLYKAVQLDSCVCFEKTIYMNSIIKYTQNLKQPQKIENVEELSRLFATRQFTIYNQKILHNYKRQILIKEPVNILYRYSSKGYIWVKCENLKNQWVKIKSIYLMNWAIKNYQKCIENSLGVQAIINFQSHSSITNKNENQEITKLLKNEQIGVFITINKDLKDVQIPLALQYQCSAFQGYEFKVIKYLYIQ